MVDADLEVFLKDLRSRLERIEERLRPTATCLKLPDAAVRLGVGLTKLKQMVRDGTIRPSTVGGTKMISISEIERISAPDQEKPKVERRQRAERWEPIPKRR